MVASSVENRRVRACVPPRKKGSLEQEEDQLEGCWKRLCQIREVEEGGGRGREPRVEQRGVAVLLWEEDRCEGDPEWWSVQKRLRIVGYAADVTGKSQATL